MSRLRRTSHVLEAARQRLAGVKSISPPPTFGANSTRSGSTICVGGWVKDETSVAMATSEESSSRGVSTELIFLADYYPLAVGGARMVAIA